MDRWWRRWPLANVAIRTGAVSHVVVLDVDPAHGGEESMIRLAERHGEMPATMTVRTGGNGLHLYFAHPGGTVRNSAGALGPGIDVRGDGGYVIAPPSGHVSGGVYLWGHVPRLAPLPEWLSALVAPPECPRSPMPSPQQRLSEVRTSAWAKSALAGELASVRSAPEGQRNHTLNRASFALGQLVGGGHLDEHAVASLLEDAGIGAGLASKEVRATVDSGMKAGQRTPRHPGARWQDSASCPPAAAIDLRTVELAPSRPRGPAIEPATVPEFFGPGLP